MLLNAKQLEEAESVYKVALEDFKVFYGKDSIELVEPLMGLGLAQVKYNTRNFNNWYFNQALEIARKIEGDNSPMVGRLYYKISEASLVNAAGDWRKANRKLQKSHEILLAELGPESVDVAVSSYRIGELAVVRKKHKNALPYLENAAKVLDAQDPTGRLTQRVHELLEKSYSSIGETDNATKHCKMVGKIKEANGDEVKEGLGVLPIYRAQPKYPRTAQMRGENGQVVLELTVTKEGMPTDIRVLSNHGHRSFIKASIDAAEKFRYAARHVNGLPVDTKGVRYRFMFNIAS